MYKNLRFKQKQLKIQKIVNLKDCYNFEDFRNIAKKKLPSPIFHYIDGGADDEITLKRNTKSFDVMSTPNNRVVFGYARIGEEFRNR